MKAYVRIGVEFFLSVLCVRVGVGKIDSVSKLMFMVF